MEEVISSAESALTYIERLLVGTSERIIIGITGKPGAGKSTITDLLLREINCSSSLIPMDGYHLSNAILRELGLADRKGAPETFDARGFTSLLERVRNNVNQDIYFPIFHREFEESYSAEGVVKAGTRLIITEGNYLLLDSGSWSGIRSVLTESWYLSVNDDLRQQRLIARSMKYGKSEEQARAWALGSDEQNAEIVATTRHLATKVIALS